MSGKNTHIIMTPPPELNGEVVQGKFTCAGCCFDDEHLRKFVHEHSIPGKNCSYCNSRPAMPVLQLFTEIERQLLKEFSDPSVCASDGKVPDLGAYFDGRELPEEADLNPQNDEFCDDFREAFAGTEWSKNSPEFPAKALFLHFDEWEKFCECVKHRHRYFFATVENWEMLTRICFGAMRAGMFRPVKVGQMLYRARMGEFKEESEMGAPPPHKARFANRMSPAGVSMFYCAFDPDTAVREICNCGRENYPATIARFQTVNDLTVLDLTNIPDMPSPLDPDGIDQRLAISFMRWFAEEVSKCVKKDGREHIEYVPTQVFTEFLSAFGGQDGGFPVTNGVVYSSAKNAGGKSCVIFSCLDDEGCDMNLSCECISHRSQALLGNASCQAPLGESDPKKRTRNREGN